MTPFHIYDQAGLLGVQAANTKNEALHYFASRLTLRVSRKSLPLVGNLIAYDILHNYNPKGGREGA